MHQKAALLLSIQTHTIFFPTKEDNPRASTWIK